MCVRVLCGACVHALPLPVCACAALARAQRHTPLPSLTCTAAIAAYKAFTLDVVLPSGAALGLELRPATNDHLGDKIPLIGIPNFVEGARGAVGRAVCGARGRRLCAPRRLHPNLKRTT